MGRGCLMHGLEFFLLLSFASPPFFLNISYYVSMLHDYHTPKSVWSEMNETVSWVIRPPRLKRGGALKLKYAGRQREQHQVVAWLNNRATIAARLQAQLSCQAGKKDPPPLPPTPIPSTLSCNFAPHPPTPLPPKLIHPPSDRCSSSSQAASKRDVTCRVCSDLINRWLAPEVGGGTRASISPTHTLS